MGKVITAGEAGSIIVPAESLNNPLSVEDRLHLEKEAIQQLFGLDEYHAQYLVDYRLNQGQSPTGIAIGGINYFQTDVPPGSVRLDTATREGDFYRAYKAQLEASQHQQQIATHEHLLEINRLQSEIAELQAEIDTLPSEIPQTPLPSATELQHQLQQKQGQQRDAVDEFLQPPTPTEAANQAPLPAPPLLQQQLQQGDAVAAILRPRTPPEDKGSASISDTLSGTGVTSSGLSATSGGSVNDNAPLSNTLPSRSQTPINFFRQTLQRNALEQLSQSRNRLNTALEQYQDPNASQWQTLRQIATTDRELTQFQVETVETLTAFVEDNITHGKVVWPGIYDFPAPEGNLSTRRAGLLQYLNANEDWAQELAKHQPELERLLDQGDLADQVQILQSQIRGQYPALEVLGSSKILETDSNQTLYSELSQTFGQAINKIDKLDNRISENPNHALQLDLTVARSLDEVTHSALVDPQDLKEITDWVQDQRTQDNLIKGAGTTSTLVLAGAAVLLTKNPQVAVALGLGAGAAGGATALYELPELENVEAAAQASLGGGELTSQVRDEARRDLWLGRANVVLAGVDLGLPVVARAAPEVMNLIAGLDPQQAKDVLQASKLALAGNVPEAQQLLQSVKGQVSNTSLSRRLDEVIPQLLRGNPEAGSINVGAIADRIGVSRLNQLNLEQAEAALLKSAYPQMDGPAKDAMDILIRRAQKNPDELAHFSERVGILVPNAQHVKTNPDVLPRLLDLTDSAFHQALTSPKTLQEAVRRAEFADSFIGKKLSELTPDELRTLKQAYNVNKNNVIQRKSVDEGYTQLTVEKPEGVIREGVGKVSDRLSKPTQMRNHYIHAQGEIPKDHQLHHLIPDSVVRDHELTQLAMKKAGYNLDESSNLLALPYTNEALETAQVGIVHLGSHKGWSEYVTERLGKARTDLRNDYGSLADVKPEVLKQTMKGLEQEFRDLLTGGNLQKLRDLNIIDENYILDGEKVIRLSENETQQAPNIEIAIATQSAIIPDQQPIQAAAYAIRSLLDQNPEDHSMALSVARTLAQDSLTDPALSAEERHAQTDTIVSAAITEALDPQVHLPSSDALNQRIEQSQQSVAVASVPPENIPPTQPQPPPDRSVNDSPPKSTAAFVVQQDPENITADLLASLSPKDLQVIDQFRENWEREKPHLSHSEGSTQIAQTITQNQHHHTRAVEREQNAGQYAKEIAQWNKWTPPIIKTLVGAGDNPTREARSEYLETQVNRQRYETLIQQDTERLTVAQQEEQALKIYQNDERTPLVDRISGLFQTTPELADQLAQANNVLDTLASTQHDAERLGLPPEIVRPFQEAAAAYGETGEINNAETLKVALEVVEQANAMEQTASEQIALG